MQGYLPISKIHSFMGNIWINTLFLHKLGYLCQKARKPSPYAGLYAGLTIVRGQIWWHWGNNPRCDVTPMCSLKCTPIKMLL